MTKQLTSGKERTMKKSSTLEASLAVLLVASSGLCKLSCGKTMILLLHHISAAVRTYSRITSNIATVLATV